MKESFKLQKKKKTQMLVLVLPESTFVYAQSMSIDFLFVFIHKNWELLEMSQQKPELISFKISGLEVHILKERRLFSNRLGQITIVNSNRLFQNDASCRAY